MTHRVQVRALDVGPLGVLTAALLLMAAVVLLAVVQRAVVDTPTMSAATVAGAPAAAPAPGDHGDASALLAAVPGDWSAAIGRFGQSCETYLKNLAAELGVTQARLEQAFRNAASATVDQAVTDKRLDAAAAARIKEAIAKADGSMCAGFGLGGAWSAGAWSGSLDFSGGSAGGRWGGFWFGGELLDVAAKTLGIERDALVTELRALAKTESLKTIAQRHNVAYATLRAALHNSMKAKLDAAVTAKTLTQAQADKILVGIDKRLDEGKLGTGFGFRWGSGLNWGFDRKPASTTP